MTLSRLISHTLIFLTAACGVPDVHHPTWTPIDRTAAASTLDEPTGRVCKSDLDSIAQGFSTLLPFMLQLYDAVKTTREAVNEARPDNPNPPPASYAPSDRSGSGTTVFLDAACAGPDSKNPNRDFSNGWVRFDSPFVEAGTGSLRVSGDVLLTWKDCNTPYGEFDGATPGYLDVNDWSLLLNGTIDFRKADEIVTLTPTVRLGDDSIELSSSAPDGGRMTYQVVFNEAAIGGGVIGSNGPFACGVKTDPIVADCVVPDDC